MVVVEFATLRACGTASKTSRRARPGLTLIELLVAISIIGILAAMLLAGVQASRAAARRAWCANNLRQIGLALNSYQSSMGCLPHTVNGGKGYSIHSMVLPQLEQTDLFNSINFSLGPLSQQNNTAGFRIAVSTFLCPADPNTLKWAPHNSFNSYPANTGYGYQVFNQKFNGMFVKPPGPPTSLADVPDGVSNTAMIAEWTLGTFRTTDIQPRRIVYPTPYPLLDGKDFDQFLALCQSVTTARHYFVFKGQNWINCGFGDTQYNHDLAVNARSCTNHHYVQEGAWSAGSFHWGGANVVFADSHVTFVRNSIALPVWRAFGTRSGGEVVDRR